MLAGGRNAGGCNAGVAVYHNGITVYRGGRGGLLAQAIYGGIYAISGGADFCGVYMADFIGVNGRFLKKVSRIA